jgi:outer membrane protein assembly factor BamD
MRLIVPILFITLNFISCSTPRPQGKTEAEVLLKEAKELIHDDRYILATEKLNALRGQYPYSYYATHAELLQADILFNQENFVEAAQAYLTFKDFHPKNDRMEYVLFRVAESFYLQVPSTYDRDLSTAFQTIKYFNELLQRYPVSEHKEVAFTRINKAKELIRSKEQYIADFYFKTESFGAARFRYREILREFKETKLRNHAVMRLVQSSYNLSEKKQCLLDYQKFKDHVTPVNKKSLASIAGECENLKE